MHCSTLNTKGGMVSVTKNYLGYKGWGDYDIKFIPTHFDTNKWMVMAYFALQFGKIWWHVMTGNYKIAHLHTAEPGRTEAIQRDRPGDGTFRSGGGS